MDALLKAKPDLQLLTELEPAHRVFLGNLTDTILRRSVPAIPTSTKPAPFWNDVFVQSSPAWGAFLESMLWHVAVISVLLGVGQIWVKQTQIQQRKIAQQSLTYYPPRQTFPALHGRPPRVPEPKPRQASRQSPLRVAKERLAREVKPPELKLAQGRPNIPVPSSAAPLYAPKLSQPAVPNGLEVAVAPPASIGAASSRRFNSPQTSAVAPAQNIGSVSARRGPSQITSAVAPAPNLRASVAKTSSNSLGNPQVVAPLAQLDNRDRGGISARVAATSLRPTVVLPTASANGSAVTSRGRGSSGLGIAVAPPPPSLRQTGTSAPGGGQLSLSGTSKVVAPIPSLNPGAGGVRRLSNSLAGAAVSAVPPPPSVAGGNSLEGLRITSLSGSGTRVIPPAASLSGQNSIAGRKSGAGLGAGNQRAVPPAPAGGTGSALQGGRTASLGNGDQQVAPPAPSGAGAQNAGPNSTAMDTKAVPPAPNLNSASAPATIELPVRVIGMALSLPNSSYFSNYEVFIAERRIKKGNPELIKLVYVSLPYQPRLTDYGLDDSKVYKLRVTRDPTCDESLLDMTWPQTDEKKSGSKYATGPPALAPNEPNNLLPCYRTTADDYRIAVTQNR
jgi:hypothetical protein